MLAAPLVGLVIGFGLVALSSWGMRNDPVGEVATTVGGLSVIAAMFSAWAIAPVSIYSLAANPALRTPGRLLATTGCAFVAAAPVLAFVLGGI